MAKKSRKTTREKRVRFFEKRFSFKYGKIDDRRRKTRRKKTPVENILRFAGERCKDESVVSGNSLFQQRFRQ